MSEGKGAGGAASTSLSISQARADLIAWAAFDRGFTSIEQLRSVYLKKQWRSWILDDAIDRNVADGTFEEDSSGRLIVHPRTRSRGRRP